MAIKQFTHKAFVYYLSDSHPSVLFLSGMHGDEYGSGRILEKLLLQSLDLPPFLYIPKVSPSAILLRRRKNTQGHDINRQFLTDTDDKEAQTVMDILSPYQFRIVIDIHEDPDRTQTFYIYDNARMSKDELEQYRTTIHTTDARLYTGVDDIEDENLGCEIEKGYYSFRSDWLQDTDKDAGFISKWMIRQDIAKRVFTVEIPGKAAHSLKHSLLETVIPFFTTTFGV